MNRGRALYSAQASWRSQETAWRMPAFSCSSWCLLAFSGFVSRAGHFSLLQTIEPRDLRNRAQGRDPAVPNLANVGLRRNKLIRNKKEGQMLWEHEDWGRMRRAGMWGTISKKRSWKMLGGCSQDIYTSDQLFLNPGGPRCPLGSRIETQKTLKIVVVGVRGNGETAHLVACRAVMKTRVWLPIRSWCVVICASVIIALECGGWAEAGRSLECQRHQSVSSGCSVAVPSPHRITARPPSRHPCVFTPRRLCRAWLSGILTGVSSAGRVLSM